jgi:hypothetical protein
MRPAVQTFHFHGVCAMERDDSIGQFPARSG